MVVAPINPTGVCRGDASGAGIMKRSSSQCFVDVTPTPVLTWLEGLDDRVTGRVEMAPGVAMRREIAAADMAARQA